MEAHYLKQELYELVKKDEKIFDFIQEGSLDGLWYWDLEKPENEWMNPRFWEVLGYDPKVMPHKASAWQDIINPDDLRFAIENFNKHVADENHPYDQQVRYKHKNGSTVWIRCRGLAIRNADGKAVRMLGAHQDITSLKQTQERLEKERQQLKESEEKYKAMYNNAPLAFQSLDINGNIIEVNTQWLKTLGYLNEEVTGKWFGDFLHPDFVEHFRINFPRFKAQGFINDVQFRMTKKSGDHIYVSFEGCIGYTPEGKFKQTYCTFKDITIEKAAEQKLKESEEKYRHLAKETADNLSNLKAATNITTIFLDTNLEIFEFSPGDHMSEHTETNKKVSLNGIAEHYKIADITKECKMVMTSLLAIEKEVTCTHDLVWWMRISPYKTLEGNIEGLVITLTDITEKKKQEAELEKYRNRLEELVEEKSLELARSHTRYKQLVETAVDAIYLIDENGIVIDTNHQATLMLEKSRDQIIGQTVDVIDPNFPVDAFLTFWEPIPFGESHIFETSHRDNSGAIVPIEVSGKKYKLDGKTYYYGIARDITERKENEKKLLQKQYHLENAQALGKIGSWDLDIAENELVWTDENYRIFGIPIGTPMTYDLFLNRVHPDDRAYVDNKWNSAMQGEEAYDLIHRLLMDDGEVKWVREKADLVFDGTGKCIKGNGFTQDITERKLNENKIIESEAKFKSYINYAPDGIFITDESGKYIEVNPAACQITGYTNEELLRLSISEILQKEEVEKGLQHFKEVNEKGISKGELGYITKKGENRYWYVAAVKLSDTRFLGFVKDTTEQRLAEQKTQDSLNLLNSFINNFPDDAWAMDKDGHMMLANNFVIKNVFKQDDLLGKTVFDLFQDDLANEIWSSGKEVLLKNKTIIADVQIPTSDGIRHKILTKFPLHNSSGEVTGMGAVAHDITDLKKSEKALKESEAKFRGIFEESNVGIALGSPAGTVLAVNDEYLRITGYRRDEFINLNYEQITHPDDLEKEKSLLERLHKGEIENYRLEKRVLSKNGQYCWLDTAISCRKNNDGKINLMIALVIDITETKRANEIVNVFFEQPMNIHLIGTAKGEITKINEGWVQTLAYSKEETLGKNIFDFIHPDDAEATLKELKELESGKKTFYFENRYKHKNGQYITLAWSAIYNSTGKILHGVAKDITQQKVYHDKLTQSEERYRELVNTVNSGIAIYKVLNDGLLGSDYIIQDFNQFALEHEKLEKKDVIGKSLKDIRPTIDDYGLINVFREVWKTGKPAFFPAKVYVDEKYSNFYENRVFRIPSGEIVAVYDDVSEREIARLEIIDSESKLKNIIDNSTNLFYTHSADTHEITFISPQVRNILGYEPEEVMSQWSDFITDNPINEQAIEYTEKAIKTGMRQPTYQMEMLRKDGKKIVVEVREAPLVENGKVKAMVGSLTDITDRIRGEQKIKQQNEEYEALNEELLQTNDELIQTLRREEEVNDRFNKAMEATSDGIFDWNLVTNSIYYSPRWKTMLGYKDDELPNDFSVWETLTDSEDVKRSWSMLKALIDGKEEKFDLEFKMKHKNGHWVDIRSRADVFKNKEGKSIRVVGTHTDITSKKRAEENLKKSEQELKLSDSRYRKAEEMGKVGNWEYNIQTTEFWASDESKRIYGFGTNKKAFTTEEVERCIPERDRVHQALVDLIEEDKPYNLEFDIIANDTGERKTITSKAELFKDEQGNSLLIRGVIQDVTQQKIAENKLRENEEKLRMAIDNSPLGITMYDMKGNITSVNKAYEKIVGYTKDELLNMSFYEITHADYLPENRELFEKMIQNNVPTFSIEKKYIHKNKNLIDVRIHAGSIHNDKGEVLFGMAFTEDITERKRLSQRNTMLSKAVEASPVGIIITNLNGEIEYVNPYFTKMTGYSPEEVMGQKPNILKSGKHNDSFYQELWKTVLAGDTWLGEFHNKKKNGDLFWENAAISPIVNEKGEITQFIAVKEDITKLKSTLADLKIAKERAEEANALKTEFLHNMSHEIRTPMNGIMGFSDLLCELEGCTDFQRNYTSIIQNSSKQLLRIIDDILEISTLETKQLSVQNSEFNLNQFITEIFTIYDLKSKERNLPLYLKKGLSNEQSNIVTDKAKLHKILSNLLDNAFKFTNSGRITFGYTFKDSTITIFVSDTGIGISKDKQERIFQRFSQESSEIAQVFGGLGLGLSIAKENAELLGGTISVDSEKGKGTTFNIEIPYKNSTNSSVINETIKATEAPTKKQLHILIAEDEEVNYLYLEAILEKIADYKINLHHVIDGKQAVEKCLQNDLIDIVLMDIKMPVMNGYIATEKIKAIKPNLPIIAQTAYSTASERDLALSHGCDDFISKPINKERLMQLINKYLEK